MAVANEGELEALTQQGLARRTVASTCTNAASSRSHCLITLTVQRRLPDGGLMHGKLTLVDLAGRTLFLCHPSHAVQTASQFQQHCQTHGRHYYYISSWAGESPHFWHVARCRRDVVCLESVRSRTLRLLVY